MGNLWTLYLAPFRSHYQDFVRFHQIFGYMPPKCPNTVGIGLGHPQYISYDFKHVLEEEMRKRFFSPADFFFFAVRALESGAPPLKSSKISKFSKNLEKSEKKKKGSQENRVFGTSYCSNRPKHDPKWFSWTFYTIWPTYLKN